MLKLNLNLSQKLNLTNDLITSIEMTGLNLIELEKFLTEESQDNVLMEYERVSRDLYDFNLSRLTKSRYNIAPSKDDEERDDLGDYNTKSKTLRDYLYEQAGLLDLRKEEYETVKFLIGNIGDDGYLKISLNEAAIILNTQTHFVYYCLKIIWTLEPKGVGARNLKECLLLQIDKDNISKKIIENHLEDLSKGRIQKIAKALELEPYEVEESLNRIKKLRPRPASGFESEKGIDYILPEIFIEVQGENINIEIEDLSSNIHINTYYAHMLKSDIDGETYDYINEKLKRTLFIIDAVKRRRKTIESVVEEIVKRQRKFFIYNGSLEPMVLKDLALDLGISESTVSRVTKNKYLQCQRGTYSLKSFFNRPLTAKDGYVSKYLVEGEILNIIKKEDVKNPLSDQKITDKLNKLGIDIKRRTVAKYRDELGIPSASRRRLK